MQLHELLDVSAPALGERVVVSDSSGQLNAAQLSAGAQRVGEWLKECGFAYLVMVDLNSRAVPLCLFGASAGGVPFVPVSFRLADDRLLSLLRRSVPCAVVADRDIADRLRSLLDERDVIRVIDRDVLLAVAEAGPSADPEAMSYGVEPSDSDAAVLLFTSGTTGEPKAAILRHENLSSYVLSTVEFAAAGVEEASLVSVPAYHIAGVSAVLSAMFTGRRLVYLEQFDPESWVETADRERITHAMVVPTMLHRVLDEADRQGASLDTLRSLAYGGGPMPGPVIERALDTWPTVDFVNAYGLTETASTVAVLGPQDHRDAPRSEDSAVRRRLGSVGRPLPTIELSIRDDDGNEVAPGERGEIWIRGDQVSGHYREMPDREDDWFRTRDSGEFDADGYLYLHGRLDDVIVRGGENLSPGEIEAVLIRHPSVEGCAVFGIPSEEWGEAVAAVVVASGDVDAEELRSWVSASLRSTQAPEVIRFRNELPTNETGKLLRRVLRDEFTDELGGS